MELEKEIEKIQNNLQARDFKTAFEKANKLVKLLPNNSFLHNLAGLALLQSGNVKISINYFQKAIDLNNNNIAPKNNLSNAYKTLGKFDLSIKLYKDILKQDPKNIKCLNNYANLKQQLNDFEGAIKLYNEALNIDPKNIIILISLASSYNSLGKFNKALKLLDKILGINPNAMVAHKIKSSLINYKTNKEHLNEMLKLISQKDPNFQQNSDLNFAIGKAYEDIEDYEKSFKYFNTANILKNKNLNFQFKNEEKLFNNVKFFFNSCDYKKQIQSLKEKKIIFIIGMPRSGTTLVEQIIASHKNVYGAGELIYLDRIIKNNYIKENNIDEKILNEDLISERSHLCDYYFDLLSLHNIKEKIVTDKAPQNFRWLGFIKIFFPKSKIVHCSRNPKDVCLSLFKNDFPSNDMNWSNSQENIAKYYNSYSNLMKFWKAKIGASIHEINYESLVSNKEIEIKKLLKFCELEFDSSCLNHHENTKTPIKTVSISQARKPIYSNSVNKNEHYKNNLNHMFSLLE